MHQAHSDFSQQPPQEFLANPSMVVVMMVVVTMVILELVAAVVVVAVVVGVGPTPMVVFF